ncbi:Uncharacterized protein Rs2_02891 [Raphanus sativus]|nr:Uncharacterized protein Rs2_02891 [Raphanus sativus]
MSSSRLFAVVHLDLFVVTVSSVHLVITTSTAPIDVTASPAPHVITGYAGYSLHHHIYSLHQRLRLGFSSVYPRSINYGSPQAIKTKPSAGDPHRTPLTHPLQGTLHSVKLAVRASSEIDETLSSSNSLDSSPTCFAGLFEFSDEFRDLPPPSRVSLCSAVDSYSDEIGIRVTFPKPPLYTVAISPFDSGHSETHSGKCFRSRAGMPSPSLAVHLCLTVTKQILICLSEDITWAWAYTSRMGLRFNQNALCELGLSLSFISSSAKAVPSMTLCVVLLRQPLRSSLQHWEIYASSETVFNRSQNPLVGFFKVDFDVCAFLLTRALGLQVKFLFGSLLSLAISIFSLVLVISIYQITIEYSSACNQYSPLDY